jgi:hypothetical protein
MPISLDCPSWVCHPEGGIQRRRYWLRQRIWIQVVRGNAGHILKLLEDFDVVIQEKTSEALFRSQVHGANSQGLDCDGLSTPRERSTSEPPSTPPNADSTSSLDGVGVGLSTPEGRARIRESSGLGVSASDSVGEGSPYLSLEMAALAVEVPFEL